jgi:hypothetical protein
MARPIKPLTRRQLYDLVWSQPATDLARKLRISSVAVGKACRRWNIPAPPRGYWAKLRHKKTVPSPPPLPDGAEPAGGIPLGARARVQDKVTKGIRLPRIKLCRPPKYPHPVVTLTADAYRNRTIGRTGLVSPVPDASHVVMAVTQPLLDRALDILNRIAWQLEQNGFVFDCAPRLRDSTIKLRYGGPEGATVRLLIMEVIERKRNGPMDGTTWCYDQWVCRSTGRLRVVVDEYFPPNVRKSWSDGQSQRLEEVTAEIPMLRQVLLNAEAHDSSPYMFPQQAAQYLKNPDRITEVAGRVLRKAGFTDSDEMPAGGHGQSRGPLHGPRQAGVRRASLRDFHSFRVTWVTLALVAGVPIEVVKKVTGHRTVEVVMKHYFRPGREEMRQTLNSRMPAVLTGHR